MPEMRSMGAEMDTEGSHVGASGPHNRRSTWPTTIAIALWFLMMLPVAGLLPDLTVNGEPVSLPGTILLGIGISIVLGLVAVLIVRVGRAATGK